jgi:hypothetical protein
VKFDQMKIRQWEKLSFHSPKLEIVSMVAMQIEIRDWDIPEKLRALRNNDLKPMREKYHAGLFAWGIMALTGRANMEFAMIEASDYDAVFRWLENGTMNYVPVQLKEVVPHRWNAGANLPDQIRALEKYTDSRDLVVAIYHSGAFHGEMQLDLDGIELAGIYVYGAASEDQMNWMIAGNLMLPEFRQITYQHPLA